MTESIKPHCRPSLFRHVAIMVYDCLLLLSVLLTASLLAVAINEGEAIEASNVLFLLYLIGVSSFFYCWFWTHGGQTLGMRTWKVRLISQTQQPITWRQACLRFLSSILAWLPLGLGFWWQYLGSDKQSWPDQFSDTFLHYDKTAKHKPLSRLS